MNEDQPPIVPDSSLQAPQPAPPPRRQRRWLSLLLTLVIFGAGLVMGAGGTVIVIRHQAWERLHHPELEVARTVGKIRWLLKLDAAQTSKVESILRQRQEAIQALRRQWQPRAEEEFALLEQQVAEIVDAQQAQRWHTACAQIRKTWVPPPPPPAK